ncbi:MAG: hypothetical protein IPI15_14215 [Saprospiraceae bacterium]|uniref:hypothetical protein n=1 Tax=Candidatus Brachybacter algidus TaxID=2982024 RepID=UPI00257C3A87|nr:hypothetical protein [Candidatus Brachybacter algidus]MBK7604710.1 hypothetical protein [Candidatus Brachybacter algidus]
MEKNSSLAIIFPSSRHLFFESLISEPGARIRMYVPGSTATSGNSIVGAILRLMMNLEL